MGIVTDRYVWSAPLPTPPAARLHVREALVPMLLWPSVPMIREIEQDLTVIEQFLLESALALDMVRAVDVEEITGIPADAVTRIAARLTALGMLEPADDAGWTPIRAGAELALARRAVPERRTVQVPFLYLADGDDLVAFPVGHQEVSLLAKALPTHEIPTPAELSGHRRAEVIRRRITEGRILGLGPDIVDVVEDTEDVPGSCPAYRCRATIRRSDDELLLSAVNAKGKKVRDCRLPAGTRLAARWTGFADGADTAADPWHDAGGYVDAEQVEPDAWTFTLGPVAARAAARDGIALGRPAGLSIHDDSAIVYTDATFAPADRTTALFFALNHAVRSLADQPAAALPPDALPTATATALQQYGFLPGALSPEDVEEQLWADRHYRHSYALRAARDFDYA